MKILIVLTIVIFLVMIFYDFYYLSRNHFRMLEDDQEDISDPYFDQWQTWKQNNNKLYSYDEDLIKFKIFKDNAKFVQEHQKQFENGQATSQLQLNEFSDLNGQQFKQLNLGLNVPTDNQLSSYTIQLQETSQTQKDWQQEGAITYVKQQGSCGSCYAFSAAAALEALYFLQFKRLYSFSTQQIVDCAIGKYYNQGCSGGNQAAAFYYVSENGITLEQFYPYKNLQQNCNKFFPIFKISSWGYVPRGSQSQLISALNKSPVASSIDASSPEFQFYKSGVITQNCGTSINHSGLIVAYGIDQLTGLRFYKFKNSWGSTWGDQGYVKIAMNGDGPGVCGIQQLNVYPIA